jgi:hypothetical protein
MAAYYVRITERKDLKRTFEDEIRRFSDERDDLSEGVIEALEDVYELDLGPLREASFMVRASEPVLPTCYQGNTRGSLGHWLIT